MTAAVLRSLCRRLVLFLVGVSALAGVALLSDRRRTLYTEDTAAAADHLPPDSRETCWCHRHYRHMLEQTEWPSTTCGLSAFARGPGQRVIAFTYYEVANRSMEAGEREYFRGVAENLELIRKLYPGYVMRLYYEVGGQTLQQLCELTCSSEQLDLCPAQFNPRLGDMRRLYPLLWRFLPSVDPQVEVFFSRDLDSRISAREVAAVHQFLASDKPVHVMRDNPNHSAPLMGGMWGARLNSTLRKDFTQAFKGMLKDSMAYIERSNGGWDQHCLRRYVWPWAKRLTYAHDSFTCRAFANTQPFPTQRLEGVGNYVGSIISLNATVTNKCPYKCRPKDHKDWSHC